MSTVMIRSVWNFQSGIGVELKGPRLMNGYCGSVSASTKEFPPFRLDRVNQCLWRNVDAGFDANGNLRDNVVGDAFSIKHGCKN
jgi:hypothetical protein